MELHWGGGGRSSFSGRRVKEQWQVRGTRQVGGLDLELKGSLAFVEGLVGKPALNNKIITN